MGTSTRKMQDKIKKILENSKKQNENFDDVIENVCYETLRAKKVKKYFGDDDFTKLVSQGVVSLNAIKSGRINDYIDNEEPIDINHIDEIEANKILDKILDKIEEEYDDIESALILAAFKVAMAESILNNGKYDERSFIMFFCSNILFRIIMEHVNESMYEVYKDKNTEDYTNKIKKYAKDWTSDHLQNSINKYLEDKNINSLVDEIIKRAGEEIKGDFNV